MPATDTSDTSPAALKDFFDAARYRHLAGELSALAPRFDRRRFLDLTLTGLEGRELMDRMRQTAVALEASLPGSYRSQLAILDRLAPRIEHGFVAIALPEFVARYGQHDFATSLAALRRLTRYGSAEFAIRPFLEQDLARGLATLQEWTRDPDEHVRRLASEGSRPRLPWGRRLTALVREPALTWPLLHALRADPSLYVRKSVANHLNDISKDHPEWMLDQLAAWDLAAAETAWIARHAARTLIKRGHPRALRLCGVTGQAQVTGIRFTVSPRRIHLGDTLRLAAELRSSAATPQRLVVDYLVHYVRPGRAASTKVFKWAEATLAPGERLELVKRQVIRDFSTRRHHSGRHQVELQINGARLATQAFILQTDQVGPG